MGRKKGKKTYRIRLAHLNTEEVTAYAVAKATGISNPTVMRYLSQEEITSDLVPIAVALIAEYFGRNWRDSDIVQVIEVNENNSSEGESAPELEAIPA